MAKFLTATLLRSMVIRPALTKINLWSSSAEELVLGPLPDTADELRSIARTLGAGEQAIFLRDQATEGAVKDLTLSDARVVAFATLDGLATVGVLVVIALSQLALFSSGNGATRLRYN